MKKTMLVATFLAVGAGSAGVSALDGVKMQGSDTLKDFTLTVISAAACPGAVGINYIGGGSGPGETNMIATIAGTATLPQTVAPMSRFLGGTASSATCSVNASKAEGIAFAADGLAIAVSRTHQSCDPHSNSGSAPNPDCNPNATSPQTGIRNSGTLATGYVIGDGTSVVPGWRDVLRQVYMGLPKSAGANPAVPTAAANNRNCANPERLELVNNWGKLFETTCTTGNCTQLNHAWRRDLLSGTTDVFRELINAKAYPFCNQRFAFDARPTLPNSPPTKLALYPSSSIKSDGSPIFEDVYQDFDPIRRACVGGADGQGGFLPDPNFATNPPTQPDFAVAVAEQVCGPQSNLGVVLPIRPPVFTNQSVDQLYPNKPCLSGNLIFGSAPKIPGTANSTLCPNGDVTFGNQASDYDPATGIINNSSDTCLIPAAQPTAGNDDARCINGANNFNPPIDPPVFPGGTTAGYALNRVDGRVFNLHQYNQFGGYRLDTELGAARSVVGNFSRIHTTRTLIAAAPSCPGTAADKRCCSQDDATSQIGCLSEADQCSFGFAGGEASAQVLTTTAGTELAYAASINNIKYDQACIVAASYPLSRKVYFNSIAGFETVTGQELALAKCFAGAATNFNSLLAAKNLFPLPTGPVCQDFPNQNCAANNTASNACTGNPAGIPQ